MGKKVIEDVLYGGSVRKWHAWRDKPGMPYAPMYWRDGIISSVYGKTIARCETLDALITQVASQKLFVLCHDLLSEHDFPFVNELLGDPSSHPYLSRTGAVSALRIAQKKSSGFLDPTSTWGIHDYPTEEHLRNVIEVFRMFGYQSTTPASLSEKVLRFTLPDIISISRPSIMLRKDILEHNVGGRIDEAKRGQFYSNVWEYDKIKAYPSLSYSVPDPSLAPVYRNFPTLDEALSYPTGYWLVHLRCHETAIAPIQINGRSPEEGEAIERWLWTEELRDCVESGYTVEKITRGYGFRGMSDFLARWADLMWEKWLMAEDMHPQVQDILKSMMVGLLGRFLRQPESHVLIPLSEARARTRGKDDGDLPLRLHIGPYFQPGDRIFSDYAMRAEYDRESTALSPVGSYIVMKMRQELYHNMLQEHRNGRKVIRSYIDCYALDGPTTLDILGTTMGQWKEKRYGPSWTEENRFIGVNLGTGKTDVVAPGLEREGEERDQFVRQFQKLV